MGVYRIHVDHPFPQSEDWNITYVASTMFRRVSSSIEVDFKIQSLRKV